ncbi:hypothetical protein BDV98DRAFT_42047 [Pterulicium gracile]|uniref:Integral membrane protein n=1 Tax=Pterulicium gracile TaxID=1884261 RepID=A0A5C3R4F3_9AGAR|nr:hypothetical protein BDV98DRAFT_42047 [Pterula gracilis]
MWPTITSYKPLEPPPLTRCDLILASMAFGFTIGFGYFVTYHAVQLTLRVKRFTSFILLVWLEIVGCTLYLLPAILLCTETIPMTFWPFFAIILGWILQLQCLIQIIANRVAILLHDRKQRQWLKLSLLAWIGLINIGVGIIWIPAVLEVSPTWVRINLIFDRMEKVLYLLTDAGLNFYFIHIVNKRLVAAGLQKYDRLVRFNKMIIWVSLSMDIMIIAMMSLKNHLIYMMVHPLAYIVKLQIEMTMSNLIVAVAKGTGVYVEEYATNTRGPSTIEGNRVDSVRVQVCTEAVSHVDPNLYNDDSLNDRDDDRDSKTVESIRMQPMGAGRTSVQNRQQEEQKSFGYPPV